MAKKTARKGRRELPLPRIPKGLLSQPVIRSREELRAIGGRARSTFDRMTTQEKLAEFSEMLLTGYTQTEIALAFGVTRPAITNIVEKLEAEWIERRHNAMDAHFGRQLAKLDRLEAEYWEGWRRSQVERAVKSSRQVKRNGGRTTLDADGNVSAVTPTELTEASLRTETALGNPAFLAGVERCIQERSRLLGLYAPEQIDAHVSFTLADAFDAAVSKTIELHRSEREEWLAGGGAVVVPEDGDIDAAMRTDDDSDAAELLAPPDESPLRDAIDNEALSGGEGVSSPSDEDDDDLRVA